MVDVIGKKLSDAVELLKGYNIIVKETISDKQKDWDNMLVIRQKKTDTTVELTVTNFKLEI